MTRVPLLFLCVLSLAAVIPARAADTLDREAAYKSALPLYRYNVKAPLAVKMVSVKTLSNARMVKFSYASAGGQRVPALLYLPLTASKSKPAPCLILLHGLGGNKEQMSLLAGLAAPLGYASLIIDEYAQGERAGKAGLPKTGAGMQQELMTGVRQTAIDVRRGLDYLQTRPEINARRVGLIGISLGAIIGAVTAGVDTRLKATALIAGGGDWGIILKTLSERNVPVGGQKLNGLQGMDWDLLRAVLAPEDPLTFAAHIAPRPLLMECGRKDLVIVPAAAQALYDAARKPANAHVQIDWYENAGHVPGFDLIYPTLQKWMAQNL